MSGLGAGVALTAALLMAGGVAFQWRGMKGLRFAPAVPKTRFSIKHLLHLIVCPRWSTGVILGVAGTGLYYLALAIAPLAVVQPVMALQIPLVPLLSAPLGGRRSSGWLWVGFFLMVAGGVIAPLAGASPTKPQVLHPELLPGLAFGLFIVGALATRLRRPWIIRALLAGLCYTLTVLSWKLGVETGAIMAWIFAGTSFTAATVLLQMAFSRGQAGPVNALATGTNVVLSVPLGVPLLGETVTAGQGASLFLLVAGLALVARKG